MDPAEIATLRGLAQGMLWLIQQLEDGGDACDNLSALCDDAESTRREADRLYDLYFKEDA